VLFPTTPFVWFFLIVMPISWVLLPAAVKRTDWLHRLPWKIFILAASYIFLGFNQPKVDFGFISLPLPCVVLATSIIGNHLLVKWMMSAQGEKARKLILTLTISLNVGGLAYFKYRNFIVEQAYGLFGDGLRLDLTSLIIPIAISFFTFQAISYVVDCYRGTIERVSIIDLAVFLSFFPHLVAGPIVRASEFIPQLRNPHNPRAVEATRAATLITRGLFKKMIVADLLYTQIVKPAFGAPNSLDSLDAIAAIYAYAAQLYCDFSGYTDIAIGIALLLGFKFPENFNRPYSATSLRDFWQRWHMTLSRWLRDYVYIPMGGNKKSIFGVKFVAFNLIATMTIGGLWHGANMTFVVWGLYHGIALTLERVMRDFNARHNIEVPVIIRRIITFHVVVFGWVIFASESVGDALTMVSKVFAGSWAEPQYLTFAIAALIVAGICTQFIPKHYTQGVGTYISTRPVMIQAILFGSCLMILSMMSATVSAFVYGFF